MLAGHPVPLSNDEYQDWVALKILEQEERERAEKKARQQGRGPRRGRRR